MTNSYATAGTATSQAFTFATAGVYTIYGRILDKDGGYTDYSTQVTVQDFEVTSFTPNATGFSVGFNEAPQLSLLNLYQGFNNALGASDVIVTGHSTGLVVGSLVWNAATNTADFVQTRGALAPDTYTVTLASQANGWVSAATGELLDGNDDLTPGDDFTAAFTVAPPTLPVLTLPDFARGPGQNVDVSDAAAGYGTALASNLPVAISNTAGVSSVSFEVDYNPNLLTVSGAQLASGITGTLSVDNSTPGKLTISVTDFSATASGAADIVDILASVPASAASLYSASGLLSIGNAQTNLGVLPNSTAVEKVAYFGDATGDGTLSGLDASLIDRNVVHLDDGFPPIP